MILPAGRWWTTTTPPKPRQQAAAEWLEVASTDFSVIDLQAGGYSDFGAANRYEYSGGAAGDAGTVVSETITIDPGLALSGNLFLGNGYAGGGNGVWTGTITLVGLDAVPAPGALALLGLAGMGRRRRS